MLQRTFQHVLLTSSVILHSNTLHIFAKQSKFDLVKHFTTKHVFKNKNETLVEQLSFKTNKSNTKLSYLTVKAAIKQREYFFQKQGVPQLKLDKIPDMKSEVEQLGIKFDPSVKGMKSLDKAVFDTKVTLPCVVVDATELAKILYMLKPYLFKIRKLNSVMDYNDACLVTNSVGLNEIDTKPQDTIATDNKEYNVEGHKVKYNYDKKVILLNPKVIQKFEDFGEFNVKVLENAKLTAKDFTHAEVLLTYDNFSAEDILKAILPDNVAMSSFTSVGHIVHCNLREELIEHKFIIGRVLLDKVPSCETVVNKAHAIDNTYRNFQMELLAGKDCMVTMHKENGCTFKMDFSKVYWNSRLSTEHERVTKEVREGDLVLDVFAGVGPFSIPAARRGAIVAANDLNPDSYAWLQASIRLNERQVKTPISATQKDARDFLQTDARAHLVRWSQSEGNSTGGTAVARVIMNLPATAVEYVRYLKVLTREEFGKLSRPPVLYLYCFLPKMDLETKKKIKCVQAAKELFERNQLPFDASKMKFHFVRDVAPNKDMYKIVVQLGEEYLVNDKRGAEEEEEEGRKKARLVEETE